MVTEACPGEVAEKVIPAPPVAIVPASLVIAADNEMLVGGGNMGTPLFCVQARFPTPRFEIISALTAQSPKKVVSSEFLPSPEFLPSKKVVSPRMIPKKVVSPRMIKVFTNRIGLWLVTSKAHPVGSRGHLATWLERIY